MSYYGNNKRYKQELIKKQLLQEDISLLKQLLSFSDRDKFIFQNTTKLYVANLKHLITNGYKFTPRTRALLRQYLDVNTDPYEVKYANSQIERIEKGTFLESTERTTNDFLAEYGLEE